MTSQNGRGRKDLKENKEEAFMPNVPKIRVGLILPSQAPFCVWLCLVDCKILGGGRKVISQA